MMKKLHFNDLLLQILGNLLLITCMPLFLYMYIDCTLIFGKKGLVSGKIFDPCLVFTPAL